MGFYLQDAGNLARLWEEKEKGMQLGHQDPWDFFLVVPTLSLLPASLFGMMAFSPPCESQLL